MNLLGAILYDPASAVNKVTTSALALTALDTTNLRINFTIPSHGRVRVRMSGTLHGATTCPQIMLGVLEGSTVRGRIAPLVGGSNLAATSLYKVEADFIVSGLTPGTVNWDAAYGVETLVAATGLKYGGPNNTTANDNFGAFVFEIYDPMPISAVHTKLDTIDDFLDTEIAAIKAKTDLLPASPANEATLTTISGLIDTEIGAIKAKTDNLPTDPADASNIAAEFTTINDMLVAIGAYIDTEVGAIKAKTDNLPATPASSADIPSADIIANGLLDLAAGVETGLTLRQAMRLLAAASAGKLSGAAGVTITIRNAVADSKDRITATVTADGNRTNMAYDLT